VGGPAITYPVGPMVPHGIYHLLKGERPEVSLQSYNDTVCFYLMGGRSEIDRTRPESVQLVELKGLIPPWETIDQQGAKEDGVTYVDALYGPTRVSARVVVRGRDARRTKRTQRHLFESLDVKEKSELGWLTQDLGYWWAPVRWYEAPPDSYSGKANRQQWTLTLRADSGFWQSYPDTDSFSLLYEDMVETFHYYTSHWVGHGLTDVWPLNYSGTGGGYIYADGNRAVWKDEGGLFTDRRTVVCGPYLDFETVTDNQVVTMRLGSAPEWSTASGSNDVWARMGKDGDDEWDGSGIRLRVTLGSVEISAWEDFEQLWARKKKIFGMVPHKDMEFTLVAGYIGDSRLFKVMKDGGEVFAYKETEGTSLLGAGQRGVGFGMMAGGALISQATPSTVSKVSAGDNTEVPRYGFLNRRNAGDQDAYDEYTLYGPGTFGIGNGPGSTDMVEIGPLDAGQIVHIRTDPRKRGLFDLTKTNTTTGPYLFGAQPSDELYKKMTGRFYQNQVPRKQPGERVQTHQIAVSMGAGCNADSKIVASLTPLRRYPE
jgi:hypothetical protein